MSGTKAWWLCTWRGCTYVASGSWPVCIHHGLQIYGDLCMVTDEKREELAARPPMTAADRERFDQMQADQLSRRRQQWGQIYYIRLNDVIKIGWTSNLHGRLVDYNPGAVLLCHHAGTRADERDLHRSFKPLRVHGREWYDGNAAIILDHVAAMVEKHGQPTVKLNMRPPRKAVTAKRGPTVTAGRH